MRVLAGLQQLLLIGIWIIAAFRGESLQRLLLQAGPGI
jgi:hypothetical protein